MGRMVRKLEGLGLVERHPDDQDGRSVIVALAPVGQALVDQVIERRRRVASGVLETVDAAVLPVIANVMNGFARADGYLDWP